MTKLYEIKTTTEWVNVNTVIGSTLSGVVELFNAGREGNADILWTESIEQPLVGAFYRILPRQKSAVFTVGTQPIWIKSELQPAKLMISAPNTATVNLKGVI